MPALGPRTLISAQPRAVSPCPSNAVGCQALAPPQPCFAWPWALLIPVCWLTAWLDLGPASSPGTCLMTWARGCLPWPALIPCWGQWDRLWLAGLCPASCGIACGSWLPTPEGAAGPCCTLSYHPPEQFVAVLHCEKVCPPPSLNLPCSILFSILHELGEHHFPFFFAVVF